LGRSAGAPFGTIAIPEHWLMGFVGNGCLRRGPVGLILLIGTFLDAPANIIIFGPMLVAVARRPDFPDPGSARSRRRILLGWSRRGRGVLLPASFIAQAKPSASPWKWCRIAGRGRGAVSHVRRAG
jgi:hypothetical protein